MPRRGPKFVEDYLLPHLNNGTFGHRLKWVNRKERTFQIAYKHKNSADWTYEDAAVFTEWDRLKDSSRFQPRCIEYFTTSRQRVNAALHKLIKAGKLLELFSYDTKKTERFFKITKAQKRLRHRSSCSEERVAPEEPAVVYSVLLDNDSGVSDLLENINLPGITSLFEDVLLQEDLMMKIKEEDYDDKACNWHMEDGGWFAQRTLECIIAEP